MDGLSVGHVLVIGVAVVALFGAGKLKDVMGDLGKGISEFKKAVKADQKDNS